MGMFSWKCKGCGEEIISDEAARLDGCAGIYDGYGRCGSYDHSGDAPVAWHQFCYKNSRDGKTSNGNSSPSAPNQGFGPPHLEFLPDYKPELLVSYFTVQIDVGEGPGVVDTDKNSHFPQLVLTPEGPQDQKMWDELRKADERIIDELAHQGKASATHWDSHDEKWAYEKSPIGNEVKFSTLKDAKAAAEKVIADGYSDYTIFVFGTQVELPKDARSCFVRGQVYRFDRRQEWQHKGQGFESVKTGKFKEETYLWSKGI